jgi:hypothetical protein
MLDSSVSANRRKAANGNTSRTLAHRVPIVSRCQISEADAAGRIRPNQLPARAVMTKSVSRIGFTKAAKITAFVTTDNNA